MKGCVENLKLQSDHDSVYLYLHLVLLWFGFLMLNGCSENITRKNFNVNGNNP